jgi:hypothetical protein
MTWVTENWLILLLVGGMIGMHLFGHGGHGKKKPPPQEKDTSDENAPQARQDTSGPGS